MPCRLIDRTLCHADKRNTSRLHGDTYSSDNRPVDNPFSKTLYRTAAIPNIMKPREQRKSDFEERDLRT